MDNLLMWRCVLWGAPVIMGVLIFIANYKVDRILEDQKKSTSIEAKAGDTYHIINNEINSGATYNISSKDQKGGFTGVVNNDIDALDEKRALRLLEEFKQSPTKFESIYDQLQTLSIPKKHFNEFKIIVDITNSLWNEKKLTSEHLDENQYQRLKNRTMPFLLSIFPKETYSDISLDKEFELCSLLQDNSNFERERFIQILNDVTNESSIQSHKYAVKSMLIDICGYSPELLPVFEKTFGKKKIREIKKLWNEHEWSGVDSGYQSLISNLD